MSGWDIASLDERGRYELGAWLWALKDHWPRRFAATLGPEGERLLRELDPLLADTNRLLKLRRLAIAEIARGERPPAP
jgi:hypothetical protein